MKNLTYLILIGIITVITSCAPRINYLGNTYSPTSNVEIFFEEKDIKKDYKVMGMVKNEGGDFEEDDPTKVQQAMVEKAKSVGADAILFVGFYNVVVTGDNTHVSKSDDGNDTSISSDSETKKIMEAKFLKYNR